MLVFQQETGIVPYCRLDLFLIWRGEFNTNFNITAAKFLISLEISDWVSCGARSYERVGTALRGGQYSTAVRVAVYQLRHPYIFTYQILRTNQSD